MHNTEIQKFISRIITGRAALNEMILFLDKNWYNLPENVKTAISHYIDDEKIRRRDAVYEIWMRLNLYEEYVSLNGNIDFSLEQWFRYQAKRVKGAFNVITKNNDIRFEIAKWRFFKLYGITAGFSQDKLSVWRWQCLWPIRVKYQKTIIYYGDWFGYDFIKQGQYHGFDNV